MSHEQTKPPPDLKARIKAGYDAIAETYNKWTEEHTEIRTRYLDRFLAELPAAPSRVLELGCGAGEPATRRLAGTGAEVTANDLSSRQIELARENERSWGLAKPVRWVEGDMMDLSLLDFPAGSLDGVVALYSIIHLPRPEQEAMLARIGTWLKPGGVLLANFSAGESEGVVMEEWLAEGGWMFWSGLGERSVERVRGEGMEVLVRGVETEGVDVEFLWVIARKRE